MRRFQAAATLLTAFVFAASAATAQTVPTIRFDATIDFLKMPPNLYLGEVAGVAVNSKGNVFIYSRTGERSDVHGATAAQLFEFGPDGTFIREIGKDLYGFAFAHTVRVDREDNIWVTDEGTNMIMKFNPAGRVLDGARPPRRGGRTRGAARRRMRRRRLPAGVRSTVRRTSPGIRPATFSSAMDTATRAW